MDRIYFDNGDYIEGAMDNSAKFINGVYHSYIKNDEFDLKFDEFTSLDINMINCDICFELINENPDDVKLKNQMKF